MPQWNCACPNCRDARNGRIPSRTQSCVAIGEGQRWFLVNASPDLRAQLETHKDLQPVFTSPRNSPIAGVLLTNADLDHVLGLFLLREGGPLILHASASVRSTLDQALGLTGILDRFCGIHWHEPPVTDFEPLPTADGPNKSLLYRAIPLPGKLPVFASDKNQRPAGLRGQKPLATNLAYQFLNPQTRRRLLVAPDVAELTEELKTAMEDSDAVLFDGTFWSGDELAQVRPGARTAKEMGHVTIRESSLVVLASLAARHRVYIHINNTNPVLLPGSPERVAVEAAGVVVGYDGLEFEV